MSTTIATILLSDAQQMIERSIAAACALNVPCSIAVVDSSVHLLSFIRKDGAMTGSAELAIDKAFTAHIFNNRTDALGELAQPGAEHPAFAWWKGRPAIVSIGPLLPSVRDEFAISNSQASLRHGGCGCGNCRCWGLGSLAFRSRSPARTSA